MKALVLVEPGDEPSLTVKDVPDPTPGPRDVVIEVVAAGVCYHDVAVMQGVLRRGVKDDVILGHEISGRIVQVGDEVSSVNVGDRVVSALTSFCGECERCLNGQEYRCYYGHGLGHGIDGGFAQYIALPEIAVIPLPDSVDLTQASILGCPMGVSLQSLRDVAKVQAGETVLVTGAGGGLGVHSIQIASALGARVLAVTTSPEKMEALENLGAEVVLSDELDFSEIVMALTEGMGVDVGLNTVRTACVRA